MSTRRRHSDTACGNGALLPPIKVCRGTRAHSVAGGTPLLRPAARPATKQAQATAMDAKGTRRRGAAVLRALAIFAWTRTLLRHQGRGTGRRRWPRRRTAADRGAPRLRTGRCEWNAQTSLISATVACPPFHARSGGRVARTRRRAAPRRCAAPAARFGSAAPARVGEHAFGTLTVI